MSQEIDPLAGSLLAPSIRLPADYGRLDEFVRLAREGEVAGFIVYGGDPELMPPFLDRIREAAGRPLLIMADYERGAGRMVEGMPVLPPAMAVGAARTPESAYMAGKITALSARALGVNVVLAPVLDVLSEIANPIIGARAFGDDPDLVSRLGIAFTEGAQEEGVLACGKHFPGHGDTSRDSHTALPVVSAPREVLEAREFVPFRAAARAGIGMLMTAHVVYEAIDPATPATFSRPILTGLLREEWGYPGLVITDALSMEGAKGGDEDPAVRALRAGADILLGPDDPWATARAVSTAMESGRLAKEVVAMCRARVGIAAGDLVCDAPVRKDLGKDYGIRIEEIARRALTAASDEDGLLIEMARRPGGVLGLIVDDDAAPARAHAFESRREDFTRGVLHITPDGIGAAGDPADEMRRADHIVMGLFGEVAVAKERAGLCPALAGFVHEVLEAHARKTIVIVFGNPCLAKGLSARTCLFAYGDSDVSLRSGLDGLFDGLDMPGLLPVRVSDRLPAGAGRTRRR